MNSVLIVVLNWNNIADTKECLASLSKQTYSNYKILLVDNGSVEPNTEKELLKLEELYGEELIVIRNTKNKGFAGGVNTGITYAINNNYNFVALFNNDAVAEKDWLELLVYAANKQGSSLTTGLLLHEDGKTVDSTGDWYTTWGLPFPRTRDQKRSATPESGVVFGVSGGGSLYTTKLFKEIGMFDETFFAYYEDVDISFRAQLAGHTAYFESKAIAYHKQGATSDKIPGFTTTQAFKNLPMLYVKNVPTGLLLPIGIRFWFAFNLMAVKALLSPRFIPTLKGLIQGVWLFWTHALPLRFTIQSRRKVTTKYINDLLVHDLPPTQVGLRRLLRRPVK